MKKKETKRPKKLENEVKDRGRTKEMIITALLGGLVGALFLGLLPYFAYYKPHLENMENQIEIMSNQLESEKIESELWVLRDARARAEEKIEKEKVEGADATTLQHLQDSYDKGIEHANNARNYWETNRFPEAWDDIDKSREQFEQIIPIIEDVTFEKTNGA